MSGNCYHHVSHGTRSRLLQLTSAECSLPFYQHIVMLSKLLKLVSK